MLKICNDMLFGKGAFIKVEFPENIDIDNINDFSLAKVLIMKSIKIGKNKIE